MMTSISSSSSTSSPQPFFSDSPVASVLTCLWGHGTQSTFQCLSSDCIQLLGHFVFLLTQQKDSLLRSESERETERVHNECACVSVLVHVCVRACERTCVRVIYTVEMLELRLRQN